MHWHSPSEHTIDGQSYPLELHLVHKASDGNHTVMGILFQYGDSDPIVEKLEEGLKRLAKEGEINEEAQIPLGAIDTEHLRVRKGALLRRAVVLNMLTGEDNFQRTS
ncbi:Alpha carbonic anhydrase domain [Dillenia turbinata]|uniref:Carbonic anhydrase n=1 Tax=Dillenia turbinata TaxID=194707 RepID=A0AAN8W9W7_9MAGN